MILLFRKSSIMLGIVIVALAAAILTVNLCMGARSPAGGLADPSDKAASIPANRPVEGDGDKPGNNATASPANPTDGPFSAAGKVVVLDAGHGGEDPGAVSSYSGAKEKDITLTIADKTRALLESAGYKVIMTRTDDVLAYDDENVSMTRKRRQDLLKRKKLMDESGADIVVSIHLNSFTDSEYSGAQVFYTKESMSSKKMAISIQESLRNNLNPQNEREALLKSEDIIITKGCKVTTVIAECGFLSNQAEEAQLCSEEYQNKIAAALKIGIDNYFATPEK